MSANQDTPPQAGQLSKTTAPQDQGSPILGFTTQVVPSNVRVQGHARLGTNELPIDALGTATQR
jgi:hypothetical protein